jgi:2-polyprenyl-6-methoxyphenol hydroxylase-like FAD-dependent oxidoreductase
MTSNDRRLDTTVLIAGAGPTGLTLACELARRGTPVRIIDAELGPRPGSRGKGVQPRSLEVFEDLGVVERILSNGRMAMPMTAIGADGSARVGGAVPESLLNRSDIPYPASVITPQWRVEETLGLLLADLGGTVEFGTSLVDFEQSDEFVTATVATKQGAATITARWLVGCDGGHSAVRKGAGIAFAGETLDDVRMIVADLAVDGVDRDAWYMWQSELGLAALCPLPSTSLFQFQASISSGQDPELSLANMQQILDARTAQSDVRLHEPEWKSLWRANIRLVERYRDRGVFLAGDAAHIHSPAGGQGMNTGIQDAANLGWKLAAVAAGAPESLLDTYEAERRPVAEHVLALSNARLKQTVTTNEVSTKRDESTIQLDINYRGSTLAIDDRTDDAGLRAGDRAPDAKGLRTVSGVYRLFELMRGGRWTLLRFGSAPDVPHLPYGTHMLHVVDNPVGSQDISDTNGSLASAYGATDGTIVLVRPDGYVAAIANGDRGAQFIEQLTGACT